LSTFCRFAFSVPFAGHERVCDGGQDGRESHEHEDDSWTASRVVSNPTLFSTVISHFIFSSLFCFSDILCCALCGDQLLARFLGPMTVRGLRKFSVFPDIKYLTKALAFQHRWGARRRFGPAPVENNIPPQLAQPSPTTFSKPNGSGNPTRSREESPSTPTPGKWNTFTHHRQHANDSSYIVMYWEKSLCNG
jgi:hypothetical protein